MRVAFFMFAVFAGGVRRDGGTNERHDRAIRIADRYIVSNTSIICGEEVRGNYNR